MSDEREEIFMGVCSAERSTTEKMRVLARFLLHSIAVRGLEPFLAVPSFADRQAGRAEDFGMCLVGDFEMRVTFRKVLSYSKGGDVARRYVLICAIFSLAVSLIRENRTCSLRDVFYFLKHMFKNQQESNRRIYDLGLLLNMTRSEMGFVPATRGLVAGDLKFRTDSAASGQGSYIDCCRTDCHFTGEAITDIWSRRQQSIQVICDARFLIVIEKQGIFRALLEAGVHNGGSPLGDCIIVTGCGYPDVATRALVSRLSKKLPDIIIIGVADYNPHGISLLLTYKFGSRSNRALEARGLAVEKMRWLGLRLHQVEELLGDQDSVLLLPMTDKDAGVAAGLVEHACFLGPEYGAYLDEVERMLQLGIKCELQQALMGVGEVSIEGFIIDAILREDYI